MCLLRIDPYNHITAKNTMYGDSHTSFLKRLVHTFHRGMLHNLFPAYLCVYISCVTIFSTPLQTIIHLCTRIEHRKSSSKDFK